MAGREERRSEDRRVKRTKKALRDCLFRLLEEKTADEITVKELTAAADINRSTFYFYYKDIDDMIFQIQDEIYAVFEETVIKKADGFNTAEDFVQYLTRFLLFCRENERVCKFVVSNDPKNKLSKRIKTGLLLPVPDVLRQGVELLNGAVLIIIETDLQVVCFFQLRWFLIVWHFAPFLLWTHSLEPCNAWPMSYDGGENQRCDNILMWSQITIFIPGQKRKCFLFRFENAMRGYGARNPHQVCRKTRFRE